MTRRRILVAVAIAALLIATGFGVYARAALAVPTDRLVLAGNVRAEEIVVRAPAITQPVPDYTVGTTAASAGPKKAAPAPAAATKSRAPVVSGLLAEVLVTQGAHVTTGQVLAQLDTTMLDLGIASAAAASAKAEADLDAIDANIGTLRSSRSKLVTARLTLTKARSGLSTTITALVAKRESLESEIAAIEALIALPGGPPPHVPPYPVLLTSLRGALSGLDAGLAGARTGLRTMDANLAKIAKGIRTIDSALARLREARDLVEVNVESSEIAVRLARARREAATITSPVSGIVTYARIPGTAVMVGAPIVRIRPDGPVRIDTYLTAEQLEHVAGGTVATVDFDSNTTGPLSARVVTIGDTAVVPPTSFPTAIVHMTRAVRVTLQLDGGSAPAGTPVDIEIPIGPAR